ncbi:MAG: UDP-N-acetylmuramoyl-tripeptide--D-alanyl-D-alanine ligase [Bacteroidales bacterium]|nr:UDP-N-acetylmuramoyl-tripeptide--D-alanyl-D-alanine ligase [Bacteroidales bacterium]
MKELYQKYLKAGSVSIDTRSISKGEIFCALKGENFDANDFVYEALSVGASLVITQNPDFENHPNCFYTEDSLSTLQKLAEYHRNQLSIPIFAVTGTNGKTTTKELLREALSCVGNTFATVGNLNNHIGVPLSLLSIKPAHKFAIIEMGANHIGEIEALCKIADPDFGLITNIGKAHLEGFGSYDGVIQAKTELYRHIYAKNATVFVNDDDSLLVYESEKLNKVFYGRKVFTINVESDKMFLTFSWKQNNVDYEINSNLTGSYNLPNFMAALAVGLHFGADAGELSKALSSYTPKNKRSQIEKTERNTLVVDAYNANPSSMALALENFASLNAENKIVILGDMLELGVDSPHEHEGILKMALSLNFNRYIFIGKEFGRFANLSTEAKFFLHVDDASAFLSQENISDALILIKGSRGIRCEKVIPVL